MTEVEGLAPGSVAPSRRDDRWVVGYHGTVRGEDLKSGGSAATPWEVAMRPRSLGLQSMSTLVGPIDRRGLPHSASGHRPLGSSAAGARAERDVWDPAAETMPQYVQRRIADARFLYLPNRGRAYRLARRALDIVGSSLLLLVGLPVMMVIAAVIRIDSPGPAIFRQQRVTRGGELFTFYKFRTMWVDAKDRFPQLYDYADSGPFSEVYYKLADDPRNTRVGRWLRRTTLDELPNLINVLKGDMTLVGPRPELPELVARYEPEDLALFFTKAGLTGLAQVAGRSLLTVRERIVLDLRYVAHQTTLLDLRILLRTLTAVVGSKGAF